MSLPQGPAVRLWSITLLGCSVCHCGGLYDPVHHIASARIYGNIDFYAYYFVDLLIGTPPQRVSVIVDTGSGVTAFPCKSCKHCGNHIDPAFDFQRSSTAKWLPCGRDCRGKCSRDRAHCSYHQGYTEGSSISGWWFRDLVRLGDSIQRNPPVSTSLGCHQDENKLFYTQKANGILGIRPPGRGAPTVLQELFADHSHIDGDIFALCLAEWGGRIVVGGYNASYHIGTVTYVPLQTSGGYYSVPLTSMSVQGKLISGPFGRTIIDSGTTYVYMASKPYSDLRGAIESYCRSHDGCGAKGHGTCWELSRGHAGLESFPVIEVVFNGAKTSWVPGAYLYRKASTSRWCYAFEDDGKRASTVLGAAWMLQQEVIFDLRGNKVGVAQARCPEFRERPLHNPHADISLPTVAPAGAPRNATAAPGGGGGAAAAAAAGGGGRGNDAPNPTISPAPDKAVSPRKRTEKHSHSHSHTHSHTKKLSLSERIGKRVLFSTAGVALLVALGGWAAARCWAGEASVGARASEGKSAHATIPSTVMGAELDGKEESNNLSDEENPLVAASKAARRWRAAEGKAAHTTTAPAAVIAESDGKDESNTISDEENPLVAASRE